MQWAVGVTTCPARVNTLLPQTLASLAAAGFQVDRVFVDGSCHVDVNLPLTVREPAIGVHGNAVLALYETFLRNRFADWYALFQDDVLLCRGVREYVEKSFTVPNAWINLITPHAEERARKNDGWFRTIQRGAGACGLVFPRAALVALLTAPCMVDRIIDPVNKRRYPRYVDRSICEALNAAGFSEYAHFPALIQHTGTQSSIRHKSWPADLCPSFVGADFDALSLFHKNLRQETAGFSRRRNAALSG